MIDACLTSNCGKKGKEIEFDMSGKKIGVGGAIMLAREIVVNRALTSLNVSNNRLCGIDEDYQGSYDFTGVTALVDAIRKHQ